MAERQRTTTSDCKINANNLSSTGTSFLAEQSQNAQRFQ
jgi:hypothetical protein